MTESKFYANVVDLSAIPEPILQLVMSDWFDRNDTIVGNKRIDDMYVRIVGDNMEQIKARENLLKINKKARHGGGVRIKERKR